jgi:hypothetical protein
MKSDVWKSVSADAKDIIDNYFKDRQMLDLPHRKLLSILGYSLKETRKIIW